MNYRHLRRMLRIGAISERTGFFMELNMEGVTESVAGLFFVLFFAAVTD